MMETREKILKLDVYKRKALGLDERYAVWPQAEAELLLDIAERRRERIRAIDLSHFSSASQRAEVAQILASRLINIQETIDYASEFLTIGVESPDQFSN